MERTVDYSNLEVLYGEAGEYTVLHSCSEALLDRGDEFLGNVTTLDFINKLEVAFEAFVLRFNPNNDVGELTTTTGLLLEYFAEFDRTCDCFLVSNLGTTLVALYLELTTETVDNNIEVKLTHTRDNGLTGLFVCLNTEGGVFFSKFLQADTELVEVFLSLRFHCDTDNGVGEFHSFEYDRSIFSAECITCTDILEAYSGTDITTADFLHRILLIGVHLEQTRDTLLLTRTAV